MAITHAIVMLNLLDNPTEHLIFDNNARMQFSYIIALLKFPHTDLVTLSLSGMKHHDNG
jgi:hypothetical protein